MTQEAFLLNTFFSYFFNLGDYLGVIFAGFLLGNLLMGIIKLFIKNP